MAEENQETPPPLPAKPFCIGRLNSCRAARRVTVRVMEALASGRIEVKVANSLFYGLSVIKNLLEIEVLEARLDALEAAQLKTNRGASKPQHIVGHA